MLPNDRTEALEKVTSLYVPFLKTEDTQKRWKILHEIEELTYDLCIDETLPNTVKKGLIEKCVKFTGMLRT